MSFRLLQTVTVFCAGVFLLSCAQDSIRPGQARSVASSAGPLTGDALGLPAPDAAVIAARDHFANTLISLQKPGGEWSGGFVSDATMEAIPLIFLAETGLSDPTVERQALDRIFSLQDPVTQTWLKYPQGPTSIETTGVVLYTLKRRGIGESDPRVSTAWRWFDVHHGFKAMNLAAQLIAVASEEVPAGEIPLINKLTTEFFSRDGAFSLVGFGSWRYMIVPFLVWNFYHRAQLKGVGVSKLSEARVASAGSLLASKIDVTEFESRKEFWAQEGIGWLLNRQQGDGSWCGYIPCTLYSAIALGAASRAGVADFSLQVRHAWQAMRARRVPLADGTIAQAPSTKATWDTARILTALRPLPVESRQLFTKQAGAAVSWLLSQEITTPGNWSVELPGVRAAAWSFQTYNKFNPDTDDTVQAIRALLEWKDLLPAYGAAIKKVSTDSISWLMHFQQRNGGFAAFGKMNYRLLKTELFAYRMVTRERLPNMFLNADNDVTARAIEGLQEYIDTYPESEIVTQVRRSLGAACKFLKKSKKTPAWAPGGVWNATWMVNYLHGTSQAIGGLLAGHCAQTSDLAPEVAWLISLQDSAGGWGESPASYDVHHYVKAAPTLSQTAFAVEALVTYEQFRFTKERAIDADIERAIRRGVGFLIARTQGQDSPRNEGVTETFIPKIWYVSYELQAHYEILRALASYAELQQIRSK